VQESLLPAAGLSYQIYKENIMNIYVGNLAQNVQEEDLNTLFSQHGNVNSVKIIRDMYSKISKGFGFIEMLVKDEAQKALDVLNSFELKGKRLVVNEARPKRENGGYERRY
jgi:RNA recognition motif-containing protein